MDEAGPTNGDQEHSQTNPLPWTLHQAQTVDRIEPRSGGTGRKFAFLLAAVLLLLGTLEIGLHVLGLLTPISDTSSSLATVPNEQALIAAGLSVTPDRQQPKVPVTVARLLVDGQHTYLIYYYTDNTAHTLVDHTTVLDQDGRDYTDYPNGDFPDNEADLCNEVTSDHPLFQFHQAAPSRRVNCLDTLRPLPPATKEVVLRIQFGIEPPQGAFHLLTTEVIRMRTDLRGLPAYEHRHA